MDSINNIAELDYQNWKNNINYILLYKYFKEKAEEANRTIKAKLEKYQKKQKKTVEQHEEYTKLLQQVVFNCSTVFKNIKQNSNNEQLIQHLQQQKNIDVSEEGYKRWLETGEKFKF